MTDKEALLLALEALYYCEALNRDVDERKMQAITVIRKLWTEHAMQEVQRLGQEIEQEPVAWMWRCNPYCDWPNWEVSLWRPADSGCYGDKRTEGYEDVPLYTAPPQRTWANLPDEEIKILWIQYRAALPRYLCFAKALLSRAKEKNT
jgi:hypothetical protein